MVVSEIKKRPPLANESRMGLNQNDSQLKGQSAEINGVVDSNSDDESDAGETRRSLLLILFTFLCSLGFLAFVYLKFPQMSSLDKEKLKLPKNIENAKDLGRVLSNYKDDYFIHVVMGFMFVYIFLQSFAIPGSIFLSILSGFLFPFPLALFLVCLCSSLGASFCYTLSALVGKQLVKKYFPVRIKEWQAHVDHHRKDILNYMIFLRITPLLPNWFINVTAPVLNVPLWPFFLGTFIGVAPPSFGFISAGFELYELTTTGDAFSFKSIALVVVAAIVSLLPVVFRKKMREKLE